MGGEARNCAVRAPSSLKEACAVSPQAWVHDGDNDDDVETVSLPQGDPDVLDREAFRDPGDDDPAELTDALMACVTRARDEEEASLQVLSIAAHARTFQLASVALWAQRSDEDQARRLRADADDATRLVAGRPQLPAALPACASMLTRSLASVNEVSAAAALCAARWRAGYDAVPSSTAVRRPAAARGGFTESGARRRQATVARRRGAPRPR